jgi:hypothetical protein
MILNKDQAKAIYDAMCALNNVGATFDEVNVINTYPRIKFFRYAWNGGFGISVNGESKEEYDDQAAFAAAYGL